MDLLKNLEVSKYKKVIFNLDTAYKWGRGWTSAEAQAFEDEVYPKLEEAGYTIRRSIDSMASDTIDEKDGTYLYLHPMDWSGYLKEEDIEKIYNILKSVSPDICHVTSYKTWDCYELSDYKYEQILCENASDIVKWIIANPYKNGFDFAKDYHIPRLRDAYGRCSSDVDIRFVNNLKNILNNLDKATSELIVQKAL